MMKRKKPGWLHRKINLAVGNTALPVHVRAGAAILSLLFEVTTKEEKPAKKPLPHDSVDLELNPETLVLKHSIRPGITPEPKQLNLFD